jgi:aminoglycoside/choline kinase family phosphotransferase
MKNKKYHTIGTIPKFNRKIPKFNRKILQNWYLQHTNTWLLTFLA